MTIKLLGLAAAIAICPGVILAQRTSPTKTTTTSSSGEVSEAVPQHAIAEQQDPNLVGSPAWWSTHLTADGRPLTGAEGSRAAEKKNL